MGDLTSMDEENAIRAADMPPWNAWPSAAALEERLAVLERKQAVLSAENVALRSKVIELSERGGRRVVPAAPEPRARVIEQIPVARLDLPNDVELVQLRPLLARSYPRWCSSDGFAPGLYRQGDPARERAADEEWFAQLKRAIGAVSQLNTLPTPNHKRGIDFHLDNCTPILRRIRMSGDLRPGPLVLACFLMRVPVSGFAQDGVTVSLGLDEYLGKPTDPSAWRVTLREGKLPTQHQPGGVRLAPPSQVRVVYGS